MKTRVLLAPMVWLGRIFRGLFRLFFGEMRVAWSPPGWLRAAGGHARGLTLLLLLVGSTAYGGWQWWLMSDAHRPRPRELTKARNVQPSVSGPSAPVWNRDKNQLEPKAVTIRFTEDAAPIEKSEREDAGKAATLSPALPGTWHWSSARALAFYPETPFPAGTKYEVTLAPAGLAPKITLSTTKLEFTTPPLSAEWTKSDFYTDPSNGTTHQAVGTVRFNQPVAREEVVRSLKVDALGGTPLFADAGAPEVLADKERANTFHIRSTKVRIPVAEDFVRLLLAPGLKPLCGGVPMEKESATKVKVPTRETGFRIADAAAQIVNDEQGEPRQFVLLTSKRVAAPEKISGAVEFWSLPAKDEEDEEAVWTAAEVTPEVLAKAKRIAGKLVEDETGAPVRESFAFHLPPSAPGQLFVRIKKGLEAAGGFVLGADFVELVDVPAFPKEARILGKGGVLALTGEKKLSIKSRGYGNLRYTLARIPTAQIHHLVSQSEGRFEAPDFERAGDFGFENLARYHQQVQGILKQNDYEANYSAFDFGPALASPDATDPDANRGLYYLTVEGVRRRAENDAPAGKNDPDDEWVVDREAGKTYRRDNRFVLLTDLGLLVKRNADGTRDVFVQSFREKAPVAGVTLVALAKNGDTIATATTDDSGHVALAALDGLKRERRPVAILARKGTDVAFIPWKREDRAVELSRFEVDGIKASAKSALDAFLFSERGVYRPGDTIHLGAVVRSRDWAGKMGGLPVVAVLVNPKEEVAGRFPANLPADGFLELKLPTQETSPTGVWRIELRRPEAKAKKKARDAEEEEDENEEEDEAKSTHLGQLLVRVEDFQPDRMKLAATWSPKTTGGWMAPQKLTAQVNLQTLFGTPATDRRVTAKLRVTAAEPNFPGWEKWTFHLPEAERFESKETELGEVESDEQGSAEYQLDLAKYAAPLLRATVDFEGFEPDGARGVRGTLSALVSPQPYLLAWRSEGDLDFLPRDVAREVQIIALGPDLKPVAVEKVTRVLLEMRHVSVLTKQDNDSLAYVSREQTKELERSEGALAAGETKLALPVQRAGRFRYEWRNADGKVLCAVAFNVVGPGDADRNLERDAELEMTLPDREFRTGDEVELSLRAPYSGAGLLTVERDKVMSWKWFKADSAASLQKIAVPEGLEGGAYVNVAFVRGLDSAEIFTNPLSVGVAPFKVSPERRKLTVELDAAQRVRPGEPLRIGFRTAKPARVTIWAVDEGIHRVTNYRTPQPIDFFFRKRTLEVGTWQLLDLLIPEYSLLSKSRAFGGDGDEPPELKLGLNPFKRRRAAPVVFWSGVVDAGPERREVIYQVPEEFAGTLNLMAMAVADDAVGVTQTKSLVKGPFVLTPNAPFFATPGDEFTATLAVANQLEGAAATNQLALRVEATPQLELLDPAATTLDVAVGAEKTVTIRVRVKDTLGNAELKFIVTAGAEKVELRSTLSVRPAMPYATEVKSGWFRQPTHEVAIGQELFPQFAKRDATISPTPLGYARGMESYLRQYPHGCAEQITSKAFPWLVLSGEADFGLPREEAAKVIADTFRVLATRQRSDGGFGYWSNQDGTDGFDFITIYVGHFLTEAKASGFEVPAPLLEGLLRRLKEMAGLPVKSRSEGNLQAAAIYLLTRHGEVTTNYALNLTDTLERLDKEKWPRDLSAGWLAATWSLLKKEPEAQALIVRHRTARRKAEIARFEWFYEAPHVESAESLMLLCRHFPKIAGSLTHDELAAITEPIEKGKFNTLSAAWSILALKSYAGLVKDSGVRLGLEELVNGQPRSLGQPRGTLFTGAFTAEAKAMRFLLQRKDDMPDVGAWYQTVEVGFPKTVPAAAETKGLEIVREFLDEKGEVVTTATAGDTLMLRLRVRNVSGERQTHVAIVDLLPGGFDNAPSALQSGLGTLEGATYVDVREDRNLIFTDLAAGASRTFQWRVRPTAAGTYTLPPGFAEAMYDRGVHGRGPAGKFVVTARK